MGQLLGNVAIGTILYLNESGNPEPYIVVHQGLPSGIYDNSCNGTWILRQKSKFRTEWNERQNNYVETSDIFEYLNKIYINDYDVNTQNIIKQIKIPYLTCGYGGTLQTGANGLSCKLFLLGANEVGITSSDYEGAPSDGTKLSYFLSGNNSSANQKRVAVTEDFPVELQYGWWLRSPYNFSDTDVIYVSDNGSVSERAGSQNLFGLRPAMVFPSNLIVDDSNNITTTQVPTISNIIVPSLGMVGESLPVSWSSVQGSGVSYQLQRKTNNSDWTTVYSGVNTTFNDTVESWTSAQYQVAVIINNVIGNYIQSTTIPITDPQALVISGNDSFLGTLTSDVLYTISSNTGNQISVTRIVNNVQVANITVNSGFSYSIPITDLPTGSNTLQLVCKVQRQEEEVTETRTWTYYKNPINIPSKGGVSQLVQNGQNIWPITLSECIKVPTYLGNTLDKALELFATTINSNIIAAGNYIGNGQYGQSNPNTLSFSTQPLLVLIYGPNNSLSITSTNSSSPAYINNTQVSWYSTVSAEEQLNATGVEYSYIAIAKTV